MNGLVPKDGSFSNVVAQKQIITPMLQANNVVVDSTLTLTNGANIVSEPDSKGVIGAETMNAGTLNATTINTTTVNALIANATALNALFINLGVTGASSPLSYYETLTMPLQFTSSMYSGPQTCTINITRIGNIVICLFQAFSSVPVNPGSKLSATGIPSRFLPGVEMNCSIIIRSANFVLLSRMTLEPNGTITVFGNIDGNFSIFGQSGLVTNAVTWIIP